VSTGDCFIKIDQVPGEAEDEDHKGEIQVSAWNWGMNANLSEGTPTGRADVHMLEFFHMVDSASAGLMQRCVENKVVPTATLTMRRAGEHDAAGKPLHYLCITLSSVRIAEVKLLHDAQNVIPLERVRLAFEKVSFDYTAQSAKGSAGSGKKGFHHTLTRI